MKENKYGVGGFWVGFLGDFFFIIPPDKSGGN